ncbi:MAG: hypothetical protein KDD47_04095 [Acidobacteria bacterium]|nr:hypothetical protein [Acidobacteriota bacterium]
MTRGSFCGVALALVLGGPAAGFAQPGDAGDANLETGWSFDCGFELRGGYRDSDLNRFESPFPFDPSMLPLGETKGFLETVDAGSHAEVSVIRLALDAAYGRWFGAGLRVDVIDLYDRNPTSEDRKVDVDELWVRFGEETEPARVPASPGFYFKLGKIPAFERQDDRHLESYGLVSTAFNRFEDLGLEAGVDLGRHFYLKTSITQGNPLFIRDPNALAGDNGIPELLQQNPDPDLKSGIVILYDSEVEEFDGENLEVGVGLGGRFESAGGQVGAEVMLWGRDRELAEGVDLHGTFYGGDLDLLRGPLNMFPLPITDTDKRELGLNLWLYAGDFSLFGQLVDQEVAGLDRSGFEVEAAWRFDLPLFWAVRGRQILPYLQPAVRYSKLDPDFEGGNLQFPAVSIRWKWEKLDLGLRLGLARGLDLTLEYADNSFVLGSGAKGENNEFLTTLRWRFSKGG